MRRIILLRPFSKGIAAGHDRRRSAISRKRTLISRKFQQFERPLSRKADIQNVAFKICTLTAALPPEAAVQVISL